MKPTDFNIDSLIESLTGTCSSIDDKLPEGMDWNDLTMDDHNKIDNEIFCCDQCGWWCENSDMSENEDDQICNDCHETNQ